MERRIGIKVHWTLTRSLLLVQGCYPGSPRPWGSINTRTRTPTKKQEVLGGGLPGVVITPAHAGLLDRLTADPPRPLDPEPRSSPKRTGVTRPTNGIHIRKCPVGIGTAMISRSGLPWPTTRRCPRNPVLPPRSRCYPRTASLGIPRLPTISPRSNCLPTFRPRPNRPSRCRTKTSRSGSPGT